MEINLASVLGFYFLVFQNYPNSYAKCWIDGSDEWSFIPKDELRDYTQKAYPDPLLLGKLEDCFNDYDLHLWDVEAGTISKLTPSFRQEELREKLKEMGQPTPNKGDTYQVGWSSSIDFDEKKGLTFKF